MYHFTKSILPFDCNFLKRNSIVASFSPAIMSSSSGNSGRQLFDAILTNSLDEVKVRLEDGFDPNTNLSMIGSYQQFKSSGKSECLDRVLLWKKNLGEAPTPVHVAVINVYLRYLQADGCEKALEILKLLLEHGGSVRKTSDNIFLWDVEGKERSVLNHPTTALDLALVLKKTLGIHRRDDHANLMDQVLVLMRNHDTEGRHAKIPTVRVSGSLVDSMSNLLLSETLSDVTFVCPDGIRLPAHKCILAASSKYFHAVFTGPWAENNNDSGEFQTQNSAESMKKVLTFIYTGDTDSCMSSVEPESILSIATEYDIEPLIAVAEQGCIRKLSTQSLKSMLLLSHAHNAKVLKQACFRYVQQRGAAILGDPDFLHLAQDSPDLWKELLTGMKDIATGSANAGARSRTSSSSPTPFYPPGDVASSSTSNNDHPQEQAQDRSNNKRQRTER